MSPFHPMGQLGRYFQPRISNMPPVALRRQQLCRFAAARHSYQKSPSLRFFRLSHTNESFERAAAIVVGAGPAGIATVGNLLETIKDGKIIWIDRHFNGGRINSAYREVPGNTAVKLFVDYAKAVEPFRNIIESAPKPNPITVLEDLPQDGTCSLSYAGDMLKFLTESLLEHPGLSPYKGDVTAAQRDTGNSMWTVATAATEAFAGLAPALLVSAPLLVYCTGSHPTKGLMPSFPSDLKSSPLEELPLDTALTPSALSALLKSKLKTKVERSENNGGRGAKLEIGVIGGSHSAVLVLMNLYAIAKEYPNREIRIKWFPRSETLKYAEQRDGYILNDNTGLKGQAAKFAREMLDGDALHNSHAGKFISRHVLQGSEEAQWMTMEFGLFDCDLCVHAIGYERDPLPCTVIGKQEITDEERQLTVKVSPKSGAIGKKANALYGAGIAFPEEVDTPEGSKEMAVGMWKFMKYLKGVVPKWVQETGATGKK
ncbi:pyridine nucleotide-disulfide oxidoreductase-domain-containing protein [Cladorrhinum sp. PSN332]|nr:pyridine nucleotide-disulfide oxidoreductase-domain-containing protein [Cladorrhinum sp. PSN332]